MIQEFTDISILGRMAYLLCMFERLLLFHNKSKEEWRWLLGKLWECTSVECIDEWCYFMANVLPDNIMHDSPEDMEYISEDEFYMLRKLYSDNTSDIDRMMRIIFELATEEIFTRVEGHSQGTLDKLQEGIELVNQHGIELISVEPFKKYLFSERFYGWGKGFDGKYLSLFL